MVIPEIHSGSRIYGIGTPIRGGVGITRGGGGLNQLSATAQAHRLPQASEHMVAALDLSCTGASSTLSDFTTPFSTIME